MNFPAVAKRTYEKRKDDPAFMRFTNVIIKTLKKITDPLIRATIVHEQVEECLDQVFMENSEAVKHLSCKKGCNGCCYSQVSVTEDEAELLADKIIERGSADLAMLRKQAGAQNSSEAWYTMPHYQRRCTFLDENGSCSVYDDRPAVCRTNFVFNDPKDCGTEDGKVKPIRLLNTEAADMVIMGGFLASKENGTLPYMVWKALTRKKFKGADSKLFPFRSDDV